MWYKVDPKDPKDPKFPDFQSDHEYTAGQMVKYAGRIYMALTPGRSGADLQAGIKDNGIIWVDDGTKKPVVTEWQPSWRYRVGAVVYARPFYFRAKQGGTSGKQSPTPDKLNDGSVIWVRTSSPAPTAWAPDKKYLESAYVGPYGGHYYKATNAAPGAAEALISGSDNPFSNAPGTSAVAESTTAVTWLDMDATPPTCTGQLYTQGCTRTSKAEIVYIAANSGTPAAVPTQPIFPIAEPARVTEPDSLAGNLQIIWMDNGTTPPTPTQPADQTVSLLNLQLPQSHSLSYFNLAAGFVYSRTPNLTYGFIADPTNKTNTQGDPTLVNKGPTFEPVLFLSAYPLPMDAEARCPHFLCLLSPKANPPGLTFGLSLSNPSGSFYAGGSFEILRNLQFVLGTNWAKVNQINANNYTPSSSATPTTYQTFSSHMFFGLSFNVSGFIQSLTSGGGGGGGGSSKSSSSSSTSSGS